MSMTHLVVVIECAWLCKIQPRNRIAQHAWIFFRIRLRHMHGDDAQSFALALIA
jgi:hypothetical protein